eukprot:1367146-Amorphochlora_amoeboformis.AAC.1
MGRVGPCQRGGRVSYGCPVSPLSMSLRMTVEQAESILPKGSFILFSAFFNFAAAGFAWLPMAVSGCLAVPLLKGTSGIDMLSRLFLSWEPVTLEPFNHARVVKSLIVL